MRLLIVLLVFLYACKETPLSSQKKVATPPAPLRDSIICPDKMSEQYTDTIPPNLFAPLNRSESICNWWMPEDTITPNGIFLKYLISNDTCCRDYLYLSWGNEQFQNLENLGELRQFNPKMTPKFAGETQDYVVLEGAASGGFPVMGWLLWVFPLKPGRGYETHEIPDLDCYDLQSMTVIRKVEHPTSTHFLEAFNIKTKRTKQIYFKQQSSPDAYSWSIDSVSVTPQNIFVRVHMDEVYKGKDNLEEKTVQLKNDLW